MPPPPAACKVNGCAGRSGVQRLLQLALRLEQVRAGHALGAPGIEHGADRLVQAQHLGVRQGACVVDPGHGQVAADSPLTERARPSKKRPAKRTGPSREF